MRYKTWLLFFSIVPIAFVVAEITVRNTDHRIEADRRYREAHCFDDRLLLLCASTNGEYLRPDGSSWTMTTDANAERIVPASVGTETEIWWIGDSITMGYLLNDSESPPYLFAELGYRVRNLGSDSLGTGGIRHRLRQALKRTSNRPSHIFWIYNTSDFTDDLRELRSESSLLYRLAFRIHYEFSRHSALYLSLRSMSSDMNQLPPGFDTAPPDDHPTFQNLREFAREIDKARLSLTILVYPGMDPRTGRPAMNDPTTEKLVRYLETNKTPSFDVIDLRKSFDQSVNAGTNPYISLDGHPSTDSGRLFARAAYLHLRR